MSMFGARPPPPTIAEVKKKAAQQGNVYFIRIPDNQGRSSCYFEVTEERFLQLKKGSWLLDTIHLERCYQLSNKNTHYFLSIARGWAPLSAEGFRHVEYLIADRKHQAKNQVDPPTLSFFAVRTRKSPTAADNQGSSTSSSPQSNVSSSNSQTQPLPDQEVHQEDPFEDSDAGTSESRESGQLQPQETQDERQPSEEQLVRSERAPSLDWDHSAEELHDPEDSPPIPSAQPTRENQVSTSTETPTLTNLVEMAQEKGNSGPSLQDRLRAEFATNDLLADERIRKIGKLLAKIDDLDAAIDRSRDYGDIGYPTVLPSARTIQSPSPALLTEALVKKMNLILHECGEKLTDTLMEAQVEERDRLRSELMEILDVFKPSPEEEAAIELQRKRRRRTNGHMKDLRPIEEPLPFLRAPDLSKGERLIVPNREIGRIFSTGTRQPREREQQPQQQANNDAGNNRGRPRSKSGNRGRNGSRSHSRGQREENAETNPQRNQRGFQGRGRGRGGWNGPSNGGNNRRNGGRP